MELRGAKSKLSNLQQEANDDLPAGLAGFEAAKEVRNMVITWFGLPSRCSFNVCKNFSGSGSREGGPCRTGQRRYDPEDRARRGPKGLTVSVERCQSLDQ